MTRERRAQVLSLLVLGGAIAIAAYRQERASTEAPREDTPRAAVFAALAAARDGNVEAYVAGHTGQMGETLRKALAEQGEAGFAASLRAAHAAIAGIALQDEKRLSGRDAKVKVEYVFADRNEAQWMYLEHDGNAWKIARTEAAERVRTVVPYGTAVR